MTFQMQEPVIHTAYCISCAVSSISNLNRWSSSLGLFCHVPLQKKRRRLRLEKMTLQVQCGVATISRLLKIINLFCKRALQKRRYSAKETYNFKKPTSRSHPRECVHSVTRRCMNTYVRDICLQQTHIFVIQMHKYMYIYIHTYTHTYIYIHTHRMHTSGTANIRIFEYRYFYLYFWI